MKYEPQNDFKPYIPANANPPELTWVAVVNGIILSAVFGVANAYLGLKLGMTVSASIPAAVISMVVLRLLLKRNSILENNMVQTIASAGETIAAGIIFTAPAFFLWEKEGVAPAPSLNSITILAMFGGILGVFFFVPFRHYLIVTEHKRLPFPEGRACAQILLSAEQGKGAGHTIFWGIGFGALAKFLTDGIRIFTDSVTIPVKKFFTELSFTPSAAMVGIGYICGLRVSATLFAGGLLSWFVLLPLIVFLGGDTIPYSGQIPISELYFQKGPFGIWNHYIRYIGAGAVAAGGICGLIKALYSMFSSFSKAEKDEQKTTVQTNVRTERNLNRWIVIGGTAVVLVLCLVLKQLPLNFLAVILLFVLGFFFSIVTCRIGGMVGASNSPSSGVTIATLLIAAFILKKAGFTGTNGMMLSMGIATVACVINSISQDTSQDLKTGFLLGATPWKQQIGEIIGVVSSAGIIGGTMLLLNEAWEFGSPELPAPQANLMKLVTEGVMGNNAPWTLILAGAACAIVFELLGISSLCVAIGTYLPIETTATIFAGGLLNWIVSKQKRNKEKGVLFSSGLVAGEGLVGVLLALFSVLKWDSRIVLTKFLNFGKSGSFILLLVIMFSVWLFCKKKDPVQNSPIPEPEPAGHDK